MSANGVDGAREFEDLVNAHYRPLYRFALGLASDASEASDLTQQTFYIWARKGRAIRDPSKAKTWLFTTLYRQFLMERRHRSRFPHRSITEADGELPGPPPEIIEHLDARTVMSALAELDEAFRAPLTLFYLGEHTYQAIAEILAIPVGTVQSRIARGKARLLERLARAAAHPAAPARVVPRGRAGGSSPARDPAGTGRETMNLGGVPTGGVVADGPGSASR